MHQFDAECDPACEYLTAVHASLICILLTHSLSLILSASACFPLSCFFSLSIIRFQEFPPGSCSSITAKAGGCSLFSYFPCPPTTWPSKFLSSQKNKQTKETPRKKCSSEINSSKAASCFFIHENAQCAPEEWLFDPPPVDQDLWPPCWSWDLVLPSSPRSPRGATGNKLLWHSGLCSHGEAHYCSHMAG